MSWSPETVTLLLGAAVVAPCSGLRRAVYRRRTLSGVARSALGTRSLDEELGLGKETTSLYQCALVT